MKYKAGLIGYPIKHSISAYIHEAGFKSLGVDGSYERLETSPEDLIERLKFLKVNDYTGFNVTIPLKVPMKLFLDSYDETANISGCVNTVKIEKDKSFRGYNTDIYGFKTSIPKELREEIKGENACIIGTGGASRAVCIALAELGVKQISFYSRNIIDSTPTVNYFKRTFSKVNFNLFQISSTGELLKSKIIVNASPVGMLGHSADKTPIKPLILEQLPKDTIIYDVIYNPAKTILIKKAEELGLRTISGLDMLIYQAVKAEEIWTGRIPDVDKMKIAALENL
ncbi:shikimate dehydrogenase [bacterium]|nr:shikimate dehydrogenase [bacterium]